MRELCTLYLFVGLWDNNIVESNLIYMYVMNALSVHDSGLKRDSGQSVDRARA